MAVTMPLYTTVLQFLTLTLFFTCIVVNGNSALGGDNCVRELQKACGAEIEAVQSKAGPEACQFLSKAITCVVCRKPNCTNFATQLVEAHAEPPSNCVLTDGDVILLQQGKKSVQICLLMTTTTTPKPTTTTTPKPTSTKPPGKSPQVRDNSDDIASSGLKPTVMLSVLAGLIVSLVLYR